MRKRVILTGGTGLVGSYLTKQLENEYELIILTRNPNKYTNTNLAKYIDWDGKTIIPEIIDGSYAIINLIGENIGKKRWQIDQKQLIMNSRKDAAEAILESFRQCTRKPQVWVQASATGFYGQESEVVFDESSPKAKNSFLADVCEEWEKPINSLNDETIRKAIIRTGVILARNSDLWKQLNMSFRFKVAAIVGNGKQYLPWIHIDDEVHAIVSAIENENWAGVFNLAAPQGATMKEVVQAIKSKKKSFITVCIPRWFLEIIFGKEKTDEIVLTNQHVIPKHLTDKGFTFKYPSIINAVNNLLE